MQNTTFIREIFLSIQGEGPYIGEQQLFIRFCTCNLACQYCDTDFDIRAAKKYSVQELLEEINKYNKKLTISLTGGEPLLSDDFLLEFLPIAKRQGHKIYLETNGTLPDNLNKIINYVDIISADIKLPSATNSKPNYNDIEKFFDISSQKEVFAKVVFDNNITENEIDFSTNLCKKYNIELILQPKTENNIIAISTEECENIFLKFAEKYDNVRLIPQIHKFLNIR